MTATEKIFVKIITPEKPFYVKEVLSVVIPAKDGPYAVLPHRAPAMKLLTAGVVSITEEKGQHKRYFVTNGVSKIRDGGCTLLVREATDADEINAESVRKRLASFENRVAKGEPLEPMEKETVGYLRMIAGCLAK